MKELKTKTKVRSLNSNRDFSILSSFLVIMCIILLSCNPIVKTLGPFSSPSVEESKKRGVFLWEYYPIEIKFFDTIDFNIKEAFAEKQYRYYSYNDLRYKVSEDKVQIKIIAQRKLSELKYFDTWVVENFDWYGDYGLVRSLQQGNPAPDTLVVRILKVDIGKNGLAGKDDKKELATFVLRRK